MNIKIRNLVSYIKNKSKRNHVGLNELDVDTKDIMETMCLKEGKYARYWLKHVHNKVIDNKLNNNKEDLRYYLTGICDGWIKYEP